MNRYFLLAGAIAFILGAIHSYLGEKHLVTPLLQSTQLFRALSGNIGLKKVALRVVWHFATIGLWGAAITLFFLAGVPVNQTFIGVARIISLTFAAYTLLVFVTPGLRLSYLFRHGAWAAFALIASLTWWETIR